MVPVRLVRRSGTGAHYVVADARQIGAPRQPPALEAAVDVAIAGRVVHVRLPVIHAWSDPVRGELTRPFVVVPPATVTPVREAVMAARKSCRGAGPRSRRRRT